MSLVEIWKTSPLHRQILLCISHWRHSHACNSFLLHSTHSLGAQVSNCRGMQDTNAGRDEGKSSMQTEEKSWKTTGFKPPVWNLCPKQAGKLEVKLTGYFELVFPKFFRSGLISSQVKNETKQQQKNQTKPKPTQTPKNSMFGTFFSMANRFE